MVLEEEWVVPPKEFGMPRPAKVGYAARHLMAALFLVVKINPALFETLIVLTSAIIVL